MEIKKGRLYFIKDEFLEIYGEKYNLMNNKEQGTKRPTYFCFRDEKDDNILWFVPMSKKYDKYMNVYIEKKEKLNREPTNFVFSNNIAGSKGVFLIQNMFPTLEKYIKEQYIKNKQEVLVPIPIQKEILEKAKKMIIYAKKGIITTYTNLPRFIQDIKHEIILSNRLNTINDIIEEDTEEDEDEPEM